MREVRRKGSEIDFSYGGVGFWASFRLLDPEPLTLYSSTLKPYSKPQGKSWKPVCFWPGLSDLLAMIGAAGAAQWATVGCQLCSFLGIRSGSLPDVTF